MSSYSDFDLALSKLHPHMYGKYVFLSERDGLPAGLEPFAQPEKLDPAKVKMADWVITMGCGESCPIFPGTHYEDWEVADPSGKPVEVVREIRDEITKRVRELLTRIS